MNENDELRKIEQAMKALGLNGACRRKLADEWIPREHFQVEIDCPQATFGRAYGHGDDLATAYHDAMVRRDDAIAQRAASERRAAA